MDDSPDLIEIRDGDITWQIDRDFVASRWRCSWGAGCQGIGDEPAPDAHLGCCSVGAGFLDEDEAMTIAALAHTLTDEQWQYRSALVEPDDLFADDTRRATRVIDGACIFLNRPGFGGGKGCALHLAALAEGDSPIDWKPSVCWQLPIRVDWSDGPPGRTGHLRRWGRADWGTDVTSMAWVCTEADESYDADRPVHETLAEELIALTGRTVWVELGRRLSATGTDDR